MSRRNRGRSPFSLFSFQDIITCVSGIIILITLMLALELSQRKQGSPQVHTAKLATQLRTAIVDVQAEVERLKVELKRKADGAQEVGGVSESVLQAELFAVNEQIKSLEAELTSLRKQQQAVARHDVALQARRFDRQKDHKKLADDEFKIKDLEDKLRQVRQKDQLVYNQRTADGKQVWLVQIERDRTLIAPAGVTAQPISVSQGSSLFGQTDFEKWLTGRATASDFMFLLVRQEGTDEFTRLRTLLTDKGYSIGFDLLGPRQSAIDPEKGTAKP